MLDVSPIIGQLAPEAVTWHVYPTTTINALGERVDGEPIDVADIVELHPATRRQLQRAEVDHAVEPLAVYTTTTVYAGGQTSAPSEMTRADGRRYEVVNVGSYGAQGGASVVLLSLLLDP